MQRIPAIFRVDVGQSAGHGHAMRCLALAEEWTQRGGEAKFLVRELPDFILQRLHGIGVEWETLAEVSGNGRDAAAVLKEVEETGAEWLVLDGHSFEPSYYDLLREAPVRLAIIDDHARAGRYPADVVLDQGLTAKPDAYSGAAASADLLLGARYALLRQEFKGAVRAREVPDRANHILITLGGADDSNMTRQVVEAVAKIDPVWTVWVVVGAGHPHGEDLEELGSQYPGQVQIISRTDNMRQLMTEADLAIASGGTTALELCHLGVPFLVVAMTESQLSSVQELERSGAARSLGWYEDATREQIEEAVRGLADDGEARKQMGHQGRRLVNGEGAARVWFRMQEQLLRLRTVTSSDEDQIWEWTAAKEVRATSYRPELTREGFEDWFAARLRSEDVHWWVGNDARGRAVGHIRFERVKDDAVISIATAPDQRGRGLGAAMVLGACRKFFPSSMAQRVRAFVQTDNWSSIRVFERCGFVRDRQEVVKGKPSHVFVLNREQWEKMR